MNTGKVPAVSVVMGVYNGASHVQSALTSILAQEDVDLEFIVVNDGSTDGTAEILRACAQRDSRVRIIEQHQSGLTAALIRGCAEARGRYIARQDAGDVSLPGRLSAQQAALDADPRLAFVSCWTEFVGPHGEFLFLERGTGKASRGTHILAPDDPRGVIDGPSCHPSVMFRREAYWKVGGYRREFYFGQDWDLWYRLAEVGQFRMLERTLYRATITPASISGRYRSGQEQFAAVARRALLSRLAGASDADLLAEAASIPRRKSARLRSRRAEAAWCYFIGECLRRNGDPRARIYLRRAARKWPLQARAWARLLQLGADAVRAAIADRT